MSHAAALLELTRPADIGRRIVAFQVRGCPAPKGSGRAMLIGGKARHVPSGSSANQRALRSWDANVRDAAAEAIGERIEPPFVGLPLRCEITFYLIRPAGHWGKKGLKPSAPPYPFTKPDAGKLARSTEDSMKGIIFDDDSRIVDSISRKRWADPGKEGASIVVEAMVS